MVDPSDDTRRTREPRRLADTSGALPDPGVFPFAAPPPRANLTPRAEVDRRAGGGTGFPQRRVHLARRVGHRHPRLRRLRALQAQQARVVRGIRGRTRPGADIGRSALVHRGRKHQPEACHLPAPRRGDPGDARRRRLREPRPSIDRAPGGTCRRAPSAATAAGALSGTGARPGKRRTRLLLPSRARLDGARDRLAGTTLGS